MTSFVLFRRNFSEEKYQDMNDWAHSDMMNTYQNKYQCDFAKERLVLLLKPGSSRIESDHPGSDPISRTCEWWYYIIKYKTNKVTSSLFKIFHYPIHSFEFVYSGERLWTTSLASSPSWFLWALMVPAQTILTSSFTTKAEFSTARACLILTKIYVMPHR